MTDEEWRPKILGFCCNWCSYAGADLAGVSRLQMPADFRIVRVMCSGRIDPLFVFKALENGADGVIAMGCHPGDCHYISGNLKAERRAKFINRILEQMGLGGRFELHWVSASEGPLFQQTIVEFEERIRKLGPSPVKVHPEKVYLSKEAQKRGYIQSSLVSLAKAMDFVPDGPIEFEENEIMEGYGFPTWDRDKCVGCGACYNSCPEKVITMDDRDGLRYIGHNSFNCRTCRTCEEVCPEKAIEIKYGFDLSQFLQDCTFEDVNMTLRICSQCGKHFATDRQLDSLKKKLETGNPENGLAPTVLPDRLFEVCDECKKNAKAKRDREVGLL